MTCGDTQISASDLRRNIHKLCKRNPKTRLTEFEGQFKASLCLLTHPVACTNKPYLQEHTQTSPTFRNTHKQALPSGTHTNKPYLQEHTQTSPIPPPVPGLCQLCLWPAQVLEQVSPNPSEVKCDIALQNPTRNRSEEFVPGNGRVTQSSLYLISLFSVPCSSFLTLLPLNILVLCFVFCYSS